LIDDERDAFLMTRALVGQIELPAIELDWVATFEEGLEALTRDEYDVFLVDYFLGDRTGLDLLREARRHQLHAPAIMLTGRGSHDVDLQAMGAGAADYLVKGQIEPEDLERSIRYALDRVESLRALWESEERHRGMFDNLPMGVYRCTPRGEFLDANPALTRILGYPDQVTLDRVYASTLYVGPDDSEPFRARLEQFGVARGFETTLRRVDGRQIRLRNTARVHRNADGETAYIEGIVEDISSTWRAGGVYQDAARFQAMYNHSGIGMLILDVSGVLQDVNAAFCSLSGRDQDELLSTDYSELWVEQDRSDVAAGLRRLSEGGEERSEQTRNLRMKDGSLREVSVVTALIRDWNEEPDHILVLVEETSRSP
jgi:PAS domain S-box-containing protein